MVEQAAAGFRAGLAAIMQMGAALNSLNGTLTIAWFDSLGLARLA